MLWHELSLRNETYRGGCLALFSPALDRGGFLRYLLPLITSVVGGSNFFIYETYICWCSRFCAVVFFENLMLRLRCQPAQNSLQHPAEATLAPTLEVKDMFRLLTRNKSRPLREA